MCTCHLGQGEEGEEWARVGGDRVYEVFGCEARTTPHHATVGPSLVASSTLALSNEARTEVASTAITQVAVGGGYGRAGHGC